MDTSIRTEETYITGKRGQKIAVKGYFPSGGGDKHPAVIFSHGFGGNYRWLEHHGISVAERGIICFFLDFCGGGMESLSDGTMQEMTVMTEVSDLEDVFAYVSGRPDVEQDSIFLMGESQGGFVSAYLSANLKERIRGAILWYPAFVIPDDAVRRLAEGITDFGGTSLSPDYDKVAAEVDIHDVMRGYEGPVLLIHGDKDGLVPIRYSEDADRTYADSELIVIPDAGHGFNARDAVFAIDRSVDFMLKNLSPRRKLFTLHINCYGSNEVTEADTGRIVRQILFDGDVRGDLFNGKILPGGVDTQIIESSGEGTLSARYILEGEDGEGNACKVYIDNRGRINEKVTYPTMAADSSVLGAFTGFPMVGYKESDENGFRIVIYAC